MTDDGFNTPENVEAQIAWLDALCFADAKEEEARCSDRGHKPSPLTAECDCGAVAYEVTE